MLRLEKIEKNHQESLKSIQSYLDSTDKPEMVAITKLLLETDVNPYSFLPDHFAGAFDTSNGFASLLHAIHHALYDDGDISFPVINDEPKISFVWKHEANYEDYVLSDTQKRFKKDYGNEYVIEQCSDVFDFIQRFELYNSKEVKRWFIQDAARHGIDFAVEVNSKHARFNLDWEFDEQILGEIKQFRQVFIKAGILKE